MFCRVAAPEAASATRGILFSTDFVASDAVGVKIVREQGQNLEFASFMTMAAEKGFGIADLEKITLETV